MSTTQEAPLFPVTQEEIGTTIWRLLEAGASKKMATDYMMNLNLSVPMFDLDGHPTSVPMDEPDCHSFVGHIDALRKRRIRRACLIRVIGGAGAIAFGVGLIASSHWVHNHVVDLDGKAAYVLPALIGALIGGILGGGYLLITGLVRLTTTIGESESILIRLKTSGRKIGLKLAEKPMKLVNKLNGSEDL